jgi:putative DNA primase/helicase
MIRAAVQQYLDEAFDPCPLEPGTKAIRIPGWNLPEKHFTLVDFQPNGNVGVRLGVPGTAPNSRLYDADLDDPKAALIADLFLPTTGAMWGRASKPRSHRVYICDDEMLSVKYDGLGGADDTLMELRGLTKDGNATQSVVPPSVWTDKHDSTHTEPIEWCPACALALAAHLPEGAMLQSGVRNIAISLLIARAFPGSGNHHQPRLALAGFLLRLPLLDDEVKNIGIAVMRLIGGDESDWQLVLSTTLAKKQAGKKFTAGTALARALGMNGPATVERIRDWFKKDEPDADEDAPATALARAFLASHYVSQDRRTLHFQQGTFYRFEECVYAEHELQLVRSELYHAFSDADKRQIDELMDALKAFTALSRHRSAPSWLIDGQRDPTAMLACRNGLLHVPTGQVIPPTPSFFTFNQIDFDFDEHAAAPTTFLAFLDSLFPEGDPDAIQLIQEIFGYVLTPDRRFQKIPLIVGPKRGGKGTLAKILKCLVGSRNVCNPTLSDLGITFGRQSLIGKTLAVIGDLRLGPKSDLSKIAEVLLSISGEDDQTVHRKNKEDWHGRLFVLFIILSNELPNLHDTSGALASRFLLLQLTKSFYANPDLTLADRIIATEMPGILKWALEGRARLYARGHFVQPESGKASIKALEELASPVGAFVRERCRVKIGGEVSQSVLFEEWRRWCAKSGHLNVGTIQVFGRDLRAALPWITDRYPRINGGRERRWQGLELTVKSVDDEEILPY